MINFLKIFTKSPKVIKKQLPSIVRTDSLKGIISNNVEIWQYKGFNVVDLVRSPKADAFMKSAKKHNNKIINDVILPIREEGTRPIRAITEYMKDGTTVTKVFDVRGDYIGKEVIGKNGCSVSEILGDKVTHSTIKCKDGSYIVTSLNYPKKMPAGTKPVCIPEAVYGITKRAMEGNTYYQALLDSGVVKKSTL